jgi:hypothetical protein
VDLATGAAASICAVVLLIAGLLKVRDRSTFASQIAAYQVVPSVAALFLGHFLPWAEILGALLILFAPWLGGLVCAALFLGFAVAVGTNVLRGRTELICGCFGPRGRQRISRTHVLMNLCLAAAAALFAMSRAGPPSLAALRTGISAVLLASLWSVARDLRRANRQLQTGK